MLPDRNQVSPVDKYLSVAACSSSIPSHPVSAGGLQAIRQLVDQSNTTQKRNVIGTMGKVMSCIARQSRHDSCACQILYMIVIMYNKKGSS